MQAREQDNCTCPQSWRWSLRTSEQVYVSIDGVVTPLQQRDGCPDGMVQREGQALARQSDLCAMQAQPCFLEAMMPGCLWGVWSIFPHIHVDPKTHIRIQARTALCAVPPRPLPGHWSACVCVCVCRCACMVCACACVCVCVCVCELAHTYQPSAIGPMYFPSRYQVGVRCQHANSISADESQQPPVCPPLVSTPRVQNESVVLELS